MKSKKEIMGQASELLAIIESSKFGGAPNGELQAMLTAIVGVFIVLQKKPEKSYSELVELHQNWLMDVIAELHRRNSEDQPFG